MTSLLKTMAVRQEEEKTPYTDQLVRFRDELQDIMMNPNMDPRSKLKLLNDKGSTYRDMLRRSRNLRLGRNAGTPSPQTPLRVQQPTPVRSTRTPRALPLTPPLPLTAEETPKRHTSRTIAQTRRLIEAKKELVRELQKPIKRKRIERDSGVGLSPVTPLAHRTRSQSRRKANQDGTGMHPFGPYMTGLGGWQRVRFLRK